ncbi:hypothetical protein [Synechococcus phage Yong-M3-232]|nr:hypothetical protein [Synechococcus phage Yong-M3-232]
MIQIIGFLGCAMLAIKLLEMAANSALRDENGEMRSTAHFAQFAGWACVLGFAFWLFVQGGQFPDMQASAPEPAPSLSAGQVDCINDAQNFEQVLACTK